MVQLLNNYDNCVNITLKAYIFLIYLILNKKNTISTVEVRAFNTYVCACAKIEENCLLRGKEIKLSHAPSVI